MKMIIPEGNSDIVYSADEVKLIWTHIQLLQNIPVRSGIHDANVRNICTINILEKESYSQEGHKMPVNSSEKLLFFVVREQCSSFHLLSFISNDWVGRESIVGNFLATADIVELSTAEVSSFSWGCEGFFGLKLRGKGLIAVVDVYFTGIYILVFDGWHIGELKRVLFLADLQENGTGSTKFLSKVLQIKLWAWSLYW
jgi:hypothetical protein